MYPRRGRRTCVAVLLLLAASVGGPLACTQLIGADKDRRAADDFNPAPALTTPMVQPTTTATVVPCAPSEKRCNGACVAIDDPTFGCTTTGCGPRCSLPNAASVKCDGTKCAVATCLPGRADCNARGDDGCEADLGLKATCGNCTTACGGAKPYCTPAGTCVDTCVTPLAVCGAPPNDECIDPTKSVTNCGACFNVCPPKTNAVGACVASTCTIACNPGFSDCDSNKLNGCEPLQPYYKDGDGDGFGAGAKAGEACTAPPGASLVATDCLDTNAKVMPGQTAFFAVGYTNASGSLSYDYDCNGAEEAQPGLVVAQCAPCAPGYAPMSPPRKGALNTFCGTTSFLSCVSASCVASSSAAYPCR